MSSEVCYLCASDEGVLLDIFADGGKAHSGKIETCLSVKIQRRNVTSTKICHKCAYEVDGCSKFVQKYTEARGIQDAKPRRSKGRCSLCAEPGIKGYIFELKEGTRLQNLLRKIRELFDDDFSKDQPSTFSICLNCRYNIDVLFDLKSVYQTTLNKLKTTTEEGRRSLGFPKTKTSVVSRKTTYIPLPELNGDKAYESDSSTASTMTTRRKRGRPRKDSASAPTFRICEQCETAVENGIDMYRYHRTGRTVCKDCWLTMDPEKVINNKRRKMGLVIKDVLSNPTKYKSIYKAERDDHGNTTYLITDDSSESEEKEKTPVKRTRRNAGSVKSLDEEQQTIPKVEPEKKKPVKRAANTTSMDNEHEPPAKVIVKGRTRNSGEASTSTGTRTRNGAFTSDSEVMVLRTRKNSTASSEKSAKAASLSDVDSSKSAVVKKRMGRPPKIPVVSPVAATKTVSSTRGRRVAAQRLASTSEKSVESVAPMRKTRANSFTSRDGASLVSRLSGSPRSSKSLSEVGSPPLRTRKSKTKSLSPKNAISDSESESPYSCGVCKVEYKNKLIGMEHELSHAKQPEVKLQRVSIPDIVLEEATTEVSLIEEPEEQSHDVTSTSDQNSEKTSDKPTEETPMETKETPEQANESNNSQDKSDNQIDKDKMNLEDIAEEIKVRDIEEKSNNDDTEEAAKPDVSKGNAGVDANEDKTEESEIAPSVEEKKAEDDEKEPARVSEDNVNGVEKGENEEETDPPIAEEPEEINENQKADISIVENVEDSEDKETSILPESDENKHDEDSDERVKSKSTSSEVINQTEKGTESPDVVEQIAEDETLKNSTEMPIKANGVDVEHETSSEDNDAEKVEKSDAGSDVETDSKVIDACDSKESVEQEIPTTEPLENENEDLDKSNDDSAHIETTTKFDETEKESLQLELETSPTKISEVEKNTAEVMRHESESSNVVNEVLREVFDLASAEVQKRLDTERPNDEKCTTPVPETLENISREIQNSADIQTSELASEDKSSNDLS